MGNYQLWDKDREIVATVGWLFGVLRHFETVFQSISDVSQREDRGENGYMRVMFKQPPPPPTASAAGPGPTITQICTRHWKFT